MYFAATHNYTADASLHCSTGLFAALAAGIIGIMVSQIPDTLSDADRALTVWQYWKDYIAVVLGLLAGVVIGWTSDYYTREDKKPTKSIADSVEEGHAVVILSGFSYGLISVV